MPDSDTLVEANKHAADTLAGYLVSCRTHHDPVPEPGSGGLASGKFLVRVPKSLHVALAERAKVGGVRMILMFTAIIAEGLGRRKIRRCRATPTRQSLRTI